MRSVSRGALSVFVFGVYLLGLGSTLILIPNPFLAVFGLPPVTDAWIRAMGMTFFFLGTYHVVAARHEFKPFFQYSVYLRPLVILFFAAFVVLKLAGPALILFGCVDLAGATWTAIALRRDS
jgi:hypothetical protein